MKRLLRSVSLFALLALGVWYFTLKQEHYQVTFSTKQPAGIVYHHILDWKPQANDGITSIQTLARERYSNIEQRVVVGDSIFTYQWELSKTNDSLTKVHVRITDEVHGLAQKIQVPFTKNSFVKRNIKNVKLVGDVLALNSKKFKVHSIRDTLFPASYCVYLPLQSTVSNKAATMLNSIVDIMGYIKENDIPLMGDPYLQVTKWDQESDLIDYNFCFPIPKTDSLPQSDRVSFMQTPAFKAIKAEFNGNYSISDKAWYYLIEYAERNNLKIKKNPTELYLNDPHTIGGNSIDWKANIYLPLAQ